MAKYYGANEYRNSLPPLPPVPQGYRQLAPRPPPTAVSGPNVELLPGVGRLKKKSPVPPLPIELVIDTHIFNNKHMN